MRIQSVVNAQKNFVNSSKNSSNNFESNNHVNKLNNKAHIYTGNASTDLAYASMFDSAIARDLKLMGLI